MALNPLEYAVIMESHLLILQVKIQKEFKTTPEYVEIQHDMDGFVMGVYLCLGQQIHNLIPKNAIHISQFKTFKSIQDYITTNEKIFIFMGEGQHKIKRKAEQIACNEAIKFINLNDEIEINV